MKHAAMLRPFLAAMAAFFCVASALAQADPIPSVVWPSTVSGRVTTFAPMTVDAANAAKFSFGAAANGSVFATAPAYAPTPGGASIPITAVGRVPKASVAAAFGRFAAKALPIVSTASALYQLGEELGFGVDPSTSLFITPGPTGPLLFAHTTQGPWTDRMTAANNWLVSKKALGVVTSDKVVESCHPDPASTTCYVCKPDNSACEYAYLFSKENDGSAGGGPVTAAQFEAAVSGRASWPSDSALGDALREVVQAGDSVAAEPEAIQGPATSTSSSSATDPATGNVTTTNVTNNYSYGGTTVTTNQTTVVTVTNPAGDVVSSQSSDTSAPEPTPSELLCGLAGQAPCLVKVDETGVPNADDMDVNKGKEAEKELDDFLRDPTSIIPAFPTINWAFVLPSSCGVIPTPQFAPFFSSLDVCQFQPMFHDVMNVVWMLGGLFGAISLFMKSALAD